MCSGSKLDRSSRSSGTISKSTDSSIVTKVDIGHEMVKVEDALPAVKRWFHGREGRWLVILDSADTIDNDRDKSYIDLGYFMPDTPGVQVVITSRSLREHGYLALAITLAGSYGSVTARFENFSPGAARLLSLFLLTTFTLI